MADWLTIQCPGCNQEREVAPGQKYMVCDSCGTKHCVFETGACKVDGCSGWLQEVEHGD